MRKGHILPNFNDSPVGIGPFCDTYFKVLFTKENVSVFDPARKTTLTGWRKLHGV